MDQTDLRAESNTLFSRKDFAEAAASGLGNDYRCIRIRSGASGGEMYGVTRVGYGLIQDCIFSAFGLYASPENARALDGASIAQFVSGMKTRRTKRLAWTVRFDHLDLKKALQKTTLREVENFTHVLELKPDSEAVSSNYSSTIKNHVRRAAREGVIVRRGSSGADLDAYYALHTELAKEKGGYKVIYPLKLLRGVLNLGTQSDFWVAEWQEKIIGGGIFFSDGTSYRYWHGAFDRAYSKQYASCAVMHHSISHACSQGFRTFNLGGSAGLDSLERFKSMWGSERRPYSSFVWRSALWGAIEKLIGRARRRLLSNPVQAK